MTRSRRPIVDTPPRAQARVLVHASVVLFAVALSVACSDGYGVTIRFSPESLAEEAVTVEVAVVDSCAEQAVADGSEPVDAIAEVEAVRGSDPDELGDVEPGLHGLYGRARSETCDVIAAGCTEFDLEGGGSDELELYLRPVDGPGCEPGFTCDSGRCIR